MPSRWPALGLTFFWCSLGLAAPAGALMLSGCSKKLEQTEKTHRRGADGAVVLSGPSMAYVKVEPASPPRVERSRTLVARVAYDERHVARVGSPVQGRVAGVSVVTGDAVKEGAVLLTLVAPDIAAAQAQVTQARTARTLAEGIAVRARTLVKDGAGSEAERIQAEAALEQAQNEERRAIAALSALGGAHGAAGYQLRSPIAGTVMERNVSVGTQVHDQDKPLVTVADLSTVWVVADVYEADLPRIRAGDQTTIRILAYPDRRFQGAIAHVGDVVDPQTRTAPTRVELANGDLSLRPGMFANMEVRGLNTAVAEVPSSAVLARRDQFYVFVRRGDGAYVQREVHLGEQHGQHVSIVSGIAPGEPVVTDGAILLDAEANEAL